MKNRKSATTKFLVPLLQRAHRKILLTGTPALNRPEEVVFPVDVELYHVTHFIHSLLHDLAVCISLLVLKCIAVIL